MARKRLYEEKEPDAIDVHFDILNEQAVIASGLQMSVVDRLKVVRYVTADLFHGENHKEAWGVVQQMAESEIVWDDQALSIACPDRELSKYLQSITESCGVAKNLSRHIDRLKWDAARMKAASGPVPAFLDRFKSTSSRPEDVLEAARQVVQCFDGHGDTSAMPAPGTTAEEQAVEIRLRMAGQANYPCGIRDLDYREDGSPRLVPGFAPANTTFITGVSGSGKSTLVAMIAYGLWKHNRKILYGAWEPGLGKVLELMACWEADIDRTQLKLGSEALRNGTITEQDIKRHAEAMREIEQGVRLLRNPFRQGRVQEEQGKRGFGKRDTTERRIDVLARYIEQSGCDVFIADLLRRAFTKFGDPSDEELALYQIQDIKDQLGVHIIGLHQQLIKGANVDKSKDHRPTTGGIKGSGGWFEVADLILGVHREYLYKNVEDNRMEIHIMKQRDGKWPIAIEFEYDSDRALLGKGREFDYRPDEGPSNELDDGIDQAFREPKRKLRPGKRHLQSVKTAESKEDESPY